MGWARDVRAGGLRPGQERVDRFAAVYQVADGEFAAAVRLAGTPDPPLDPGVLGQRGSRIERQDQSAL
jgi:hypothetical protein